MKWVFV